MKDKKEIAEASSAGDDFSENEYAVTKSKGEKTFADFVDKVIEQLSVKNKNKKPSFCKLKEPNDPLTVLRSRGLIDIENTHAEPDTPASEVDLTLYTEESRVGNVVKVFSSTHRFKNGRLVYSTTQEACPELDEEIEKFNQWWKAQDPERVKDIDEKAACLRNKYAGKKLCDIFKDIQKQQIIRRYENARRKNQASCKALPSVEMSQISKNLVSKEEKPNFSQKEVIFTKTPAQTVCLPCCEKMIPRNMSSAYSTINQAAKNGSLQSESSDGKVTYRASWLHRSPRKGERKDSPWPHISSQKGQRKDSVFLYASPQKGQRKDSPWILLSSQKGQRKDSQWTRISPQKNQRKDSPWIHLSSQKDQTKVVPWTHLSPKKGQRKDSSDLRNPRSTLTENKRDLNQKNFGCDSSQNGFKNKVAPFVLASKLQRSMSNNRKLPFRPRPIPIRKSSLSADRGKELKSLLNKQSLDGGDSLQIYNPKSFKHYINDINTRCHCACEQVSESELSDEHLGHGYYPGGKDINLCVHSYQGLKGPIHANADFDKNGNYSSDNNTSLCTIFYDANGDWVNEDHDSSLDQNPQDMVKCRRKNDNKVIELIPYPPSPKISNKCLARCCPRYCCYSQKCCSDDSLENSKNHRKVLELIPYPPSPKISNKCPTRGCSRVCCYSQKCCPGDSLGNSIECFAKCRRKHQDKQDVSIMTGIVPSCNGRGLLDEKYEAMKIIESLVNEKALEEFGKRRGKDLIEESDFKTLSTIARQQFCKEISDCCQQRRKMENRKRK